MNHRLHEVLTDARKLGLAFTARRQVSRLVARDGISVFEVPGYGKFRTRNGDTDFTTIRQVIRDREYDIHRFPEASKRVYARYEHILAKGQVPVIIDAGANIGAACVYFARDFPLSSIIAIEPDPQNAAMLRLNTAARPNIKVVEAAIGADAGHVSLEGGGASWAVRTIRADSGCPVVTIDDALATVPKGEAFIVKLDIEGFELDLFKNNTEWIDRTTVLMIEPHDWMTPGTSVSFQKVMGDKGFDVFIAGENLFYVNPRLC